MEDNIDKEKEGESKNEDTIPSENDGKDIINFNMIKKNIKNNTININEIWNDNSKYKLKYTNLLELIKSRDKKQYYNENEYFCNILLMPMKIEFSNKMSTLNLLSLYYSKNKKLDQSFIIANKFDKCLDSLNAIDASLYINVFYILHFIEAYIYLFVYYPYYSYSF